MFPVDHGNVVLVGETPNEHGNMFPVDHGSVVLFGENTTSQPTALIIEDTRLVEPELQKCGYRPIRLTHAEMISASGSRARQQLAQGKIALLWITVSKGKPQSKKFNRHWQTTVDWIHKASAVNTEIHYFGPPTNIWDIR